MIYANVSTRATEIEKLVASNELNSATKRLMDLVEDFAIEKRQKREAINIRAIYNELREDSRLYGRTEEINGRTKQLRNQILELNDVITEAVLAQTNVSKEIVNLQSRITSEYHAKDNVDNEIKTKLELEKDEFIRAKRLDKPFTNIVFEGKGISKTYGSKSIKFTLHPIDLKLRLGEITAVVGENGNGKSTLLNIVAGNLTIDAGILKYPFLILNEKTYDYSIKQQIAFIPQELPKWRNTVAENLHFSAAIHGIKGKENEEEVDFIISRLGLNRYKNAGWHEISGGFKMRFSLARALVWGPKLVILDEPLANLDINTQTLFLQDLRNLANSVANPMSVLVSSQHLHKVESIADNIIFLKDGVTIYNDKIKNFGADREENIYEIECELLKEDLMDLLENIAYTHIETVGNNFLIYASTHVTDLQFLKIFTENNIKLNYFRNISKSTRKLFTTNEYDT
ncbi:MAG: ABC transporter ATP-binding protein [Anaerolineae bacterium]|nr:ABC transporter ATP-binding protein [Anaerolineae bacterium]